MGSLAVGWPTDPELLFAGGEAVDTTDFAIEAACEAEVAASCEGGHLEEFRSIVCRSSAP